MNGIGVMSLVVLITSFLLTLLAGVSRSQPVDTFSGMIRLDGFTTYMSLLIDIGGAISVLLSWMYFGHQSSPQAETKSRFIPEYHALMLTIVLGAHLLVASANLLMIFISLELISICSYVLTGFLFDKKSTEGSLKYFLFGSTASAVMLYGFSILYGFTGTLNIFDDDFSSHLLMHTTPLFFVGGLMALAGFFYKVAAAPMHPWAPDVYESAPMPVVAFFSVVPKLAGLAILARFVIILSLGGRSPYDWQMLLGVIAMLTLTVGNFSALIQKNPKRLMAYSSIAQSGFLLVGITAFLPLGIQFMLFYATVYLVMNFLVFLYLQYFEMKGLTTIASYQNAGIRFLWPSIFLLFGLVSLTGLPPTAGFTAKFFIFSALWESYQLTGKVVLLWLLIIGLLNTVVSLFYYLRIPYYSFIKSGDSASKANNITPSPTVSISSDNLYKGGNLLGFILVIALLLLFFLPGLLMGWINKINFVL